MAHKLVAAILVTLLYGAVQTSQPTHKISFTFDFDFSVTPAYSPKVKQACVQVCSANKWPEEGTGGGAMEPTDQGKTPQEVA